MSSDYRSDRSHLISCEGRETDRPPDGRLQGALVTTNADCDGDQRSGLDCAEMPELVCRRRVI